MNKVLSKTTKLTIAACCLLVSIGFFVTVTFAWFTRNDYAKANGISMKIAGEIPLKIYKELGGEDIAATSITATTVHIDNVNEDGYTTIQPGSTGYFTYYAEYDSESHSDSYHYGFTINVVNNVFADEEGYQSGVKDDAKVDSLTFVNSHLFFFTNKSEDGIYSNWIQNNTLQEFVFEESESKYIDERKIYWVWVQDYNDVFGSGTGLISEKDKTAINAYYKNVENASKIFLYGELSSDGYDGADYIIGTTLKYICFEIIFS